MTSNENYLDPNSGAAPQPGGFGAAPSLDLDNEPTDVGADTSSLTDQTPPGNAEREDWVAYARRAGASDAELLPQDEGGLSRDDLRDKYGV